MYQQIRLSDHTRVGAPGPLPYCIANWSREAVADLDAMQLDPVFGHAGMGFWPVTVTAPAYDPQTHAEADTIVWTVSVDDKRVDGVQDLRALSGAEVAALLDTAKAQRKADVQAKRDTLLVGGFSYDFGSPYGIKTLQTRVADETNWLTLQASCLAAITLGQGASVGAAIRTLDNTNITLTWTAGLQCMLAMAAWDAGIYARSWTLKDAIAATADLASLEAIDLTAGWPAN